MQDRLIGEIYDFDNAIYPDPKNKNEIFLRSAIEAAYHLAPHLGKETIEQDALRSYPEYGTDFAVFVEKHGIPESSIHPLYHRLAMEDIFSDIEPDEEICTHFEKRLSAQIPFSIVTHGSLEWLQYGLKKLGLSNMFREHFLFAVDMPSINYNYKHMSLYPLNVAARAMDVGNVGNVRFFDDSRNNLRMAHSGGAETVLVHWGHDKPKHDDGHYIDRKVKKVSDYTI